MRHWIFKSEPGCFSIQDLASAPGKVSSWDGVRNYQARNFMRDDMKLGDLGFFYNSGKTPEFAGILKICREAYPDHTALDPDNEHFDPGASVEKPRWFMVDVCLVEIFPISLPRTVLKGYPELADMELLRPGSRLSVLPVDAGHFQRILELVQQFGKKKS